MGDNTITPNFLDNVNTRKLVEQTPLKLTYENSYHVLLFRKILEIAITQGRWTGKMPSIS